MTRRRRQGSGSWWPANLARRTVTVATQPDLLTEDVYAIPDTYAGRAMAGRSGSVRAGNGASAAYKFSGYMSLGMAVPTLSPVSPMRSPNVALPATSGATVLPAYAGGSVVDSLAAVPPGRR